MKSRRNVWKVSGTEIQECCLGGWWGCSLSMLLSTVLVSCQGPGLKSWSLSCGSIERFGSGTKEKEFRGLRRTLRGHWVFSILLPTLSACHEVSWLLYHTHYLPWFLPHYEPNHTMDAGQKPPKLWATIDLSALEVDCLRRFIIARKADYDGWKEMTSAAVTLCPHLRPDHPDLNGDTE